MSSIWRYAISKDQPSNGNQAITLQDELKIVGEYLKITEVRFAGRFSWEICAEDDVMESPCLKMLLQPLIENAVTHGLEDCYRDGRIELKCARRDDMTDPRGTAQPAFGPYRYDERTSPHPDGVWRTVWTGHPIHRYMTLATTQRKW